MAEILELALLGAPELHLAGQPLARLRSVKTYALLYYLAVTRRAQPRTVLAGLFWGGVDEYYARRNLNRTLSDLMRYVGDHLLVDRQSLAFARNQPYRLDVEVLEEATKTPPTAQSLPGLTAAADLYRGDFLDGFDVQDAPEFEQWVLAEQARLRTCVLQLLATLAQFHTEQGDLIQAMTYVRRILQLEPWREEAHRQLMLLLAQSGQRSAALAQFELCRQALRSELAVEPDAATLDLVARIRTGGFDTVTDDTVTDDTVTDDTVTDDTVTMVETPPPPSSHPVIRSPGHPVIRSSGHAAPPSLPHNLPAQRTSFVGRAAELADIMRLLLAEEDCRLLTLIGPGGMGKTRLAITAAEQIVAVPAPQQRFPDGIFFVPLENVRDEDGLVTAVIAAVTAESRVPAQGDAPLPEQLFHFLRHKALLLVLDNFEHLLTAAPLLSDLLLAAPKVKLLATSRESLGLQEAWFYPVLGLTMPSGAAEQPRGQEEYDAVLFFAQCARRMRPDFVLERERDAVLRICALVDGMPLAIELAAAWFKVMTCAEIAQEVARGLDILTARYQNIPVRQRSMRVVMEHSWALLAAEEREALARLAVFRGQFSQMAANVITGTPIFTLATLVEKALVRLTPAGRYQMHELTRQYAAEQIDGTAQTALRDAHASYYAGLLHQQQPHLFTAIYKEVLDVVATEFDNVRHAWQWIVETIRQGREGLPVTTLLQQMAEVWTAYHLFNALSLSGLALFSHATQVMEAAGWAANDGSRPAQPHQQAAWVHVWLYTGLFYQEIGHFRTSLTIAEEALVICRSLNVEYDLVRALLLYGHTQVRRGTYAAAIVTLQEALDLCRRLGWAAGRAEALNGLGQTASSQGHYAEAQAYLYESLALGQEVGYQPWIIRTLTMLGTTYSHQRDYGQALSFYERALTIAQAEGYQTQIMNIISNLGGVQRGFGRYPLSETYYQESLALARSLGDKRWIAANLNGLSITYLEMGDLTSAERALREAVTVAHQNESTPDTLGSIALLGHVLARRGQLETALRAIAFAEQHPAVMARDRLTNAPLLAELRSELSATLFDAAAAWAASQSLDDVVRWLLHGAV
ncbi:MAG: tetratricopeptide repeat protein [Caldilineaceae bacterium]